MLWVHLLSGYLLTFVKFFFYFLYLSLWPSEFSNLGHILVIPLHMHILSEVPFNCLMVSAVLYYNGSLIQSWVGKCKTLGTSLLKVAIARIWKYQFSKEFGPHRGVTRLNSMKLLNPLRVLFWYSQLIELAISMYTEGSYLLSILLYLPVFDLIFENAIFNWFS